MDDFSNVRRRTISLIKLGFALEYIVVPVTDRVDRWAIYRLSNLGFRGVVCVFQDGNFGLD